MISKPVKRFFCALMATSALTNYAYAAVAGDELAIDEAPMTASQLADARGGFSSGGFNFNFGVTIAAVAPVNVAPVAAVAPVNVAPVNIAPVAAVAPVNVATVAPVNVAAVAPVNVAAVAPVNVAAVAPVSVAPVDIAPVAAVNVAPVAPVSVASLAPVSVAPVDVAPVSVAMPAPAAGVAPVDITPALAAATTPAPQISTVPSVSGLGTGAQTAAAQPTAAAANESNLPAALIATTSLVPANNPAAATPISSATFSTSREVPVEVSTVTPQSTAFVINNDLDGAIIRQTVTIDVEIMNFHDVLAGASAGTSVGHFVANAAFLGSLN